MTEQQAKLYRYLLDRVDNPVAASFEEMRVALGIASKSGVSRVVDALVEQGKVTRGPGHSRTVRAVRGSPCDGIPSAVMIAELKRRGDL